MRFATRKKFLDLAWSASDLDAAAEFWLRLYEASAGTQGFTATPEHITEVRLRGFPRAEGELLVNELARRAAQSEFRRPVVELTDPDTLVLTSEVTHGADSPPVGLGLPMLVGPGFDGLMVEFRITATGGEKKLLRTPQLSFTLVMIGQVVGGVFILKTLWRTGSSEWEDDVCWHGEWPNANDWLEAFEDYRDTGAVPVPLAKTICVSRDADRIGGLVVKLIHVPLDKPRLAGLAWRWLFFAVIFSVIALATYWLVTTERWFWLLLLVGLTWWVFWVFSHFARNELRLWFAGYRAFREMYGKLYEEAHRLVPPPPAIVTEMEQNPYVRKWTADLQAAGFVYMGDAVVEPQFVGNGAFRVFRAPDGITYLALIFSFSTAKDPAEGFYTWPAQVSLIAHTLFTDGGYAVSINGRSNGYRRKRTGPEVFVRIFPDETDPVEFVRQHATAARDFANMTGRRALKHESFADYIRRQDAMLEDERRLFSGNPYTWSDHFWWFLQIPRRTYRG
ncbi:MAG: hypothetical protein L0241_21865 [Planctomycetia bacterium]|nr:hypothetical protein [Planctomycetia bacterium]